MTWFLFVFLLYVYQVEVMSVLKEGVGAKRKQISGVFFWLISFFYNFFKIFWKPATETLLNMHKICENVLHEGQMKFCGISLDKIVKANRCVYNIKES